MRHGKAIVKSMAFEMYKMCANGLVNPDWKVDSPMDGPEFRQVLGKQLCQYRSKNMEYPGDELLRHTTRLPRHRRGNNTAKSSHALEMTSNGIFRVSYNQYLDAKCSRRNKVSRLCTGDMNLLKKHLQSYKPHGAAQCQVCKKVCYWICLLCGLCSCMKSDKSMVSMSCCLDLHDDNYFGLVMEDRITLFGEQQKNYKKPLASNVSQNTVHIQRLYKQYMKDMLNEGG